ncbi:MAG TPA: NmrA family NAD(P)-binding protein [Thermoanaerobaculia bacterium]|jgi:uncharacterized protein YbjT (DUF2867 family)
MPKTILVVGATGNHGPVVARRLSDDGFDVRVLTRRREKALGKLGDRFPIFQGDIFDDGALQAALAGCWGVHVNLRGWWKDKSHDRIEHRGTANVVRAAKEAGVERLTYLSCLHARPEYAAELPSLKAKVDAEAAVRAGGIPYAIFAPSFFMENTYHLQPGKRLFVPEIPGRKFHYIAGDDYARLVSKVFQMPEAPNRRFELYGPEAITQEEAVRRYCAQVRPETRIHFIPVWVGDLYCRLIRHKNRQYAMRVVRFYKRVGEPGGPETADRSLGTPGTTYQSWCEAQHTVPAV